MSNSAIKNTLDRLLAAVASRDLDAALSTMSPDLIWDINGPPEIPYAGVFYGHDGYKKFWWLLSSTLSFHSAGVRSTVYGENQAITLGGEAGRVVATGRPYHYDWAIEYLFGPDAKIVRMRQYFDPTHIQAALSGTRDWPESGAPSPAQRKA